MLNPDRISYADVLAYAEAHDVVPVPTLAQSARSADERVPDLRITCDVIAGTSALESIDCRS
jgi:hypothetical protein